ncbi:MAG: hypothetical protein R3E26_03215 [Nitrosomonas sp.]
MLRYPLIFPQFAEQRHLFPGTLSGLLTRWKALTGLSAWFWSICW